MTIRNRLTLRFASLVSSILLLAFVSVYAFCWYSTAQDFYRRLDRKAATTGDMLIRHRLNADLIRQLNRLRRDQLPGQTILVFDGHNSRVFASTDASPLQVDLALLADIRRDKQQHFRRGRVYLSGSRYMTAAGMYVVVASAEDSYGDAFLRRLLWTLIGLFGLIVGLTALSGWLFAGDALRPMQHINQTLAHIFPKNRTERLPVRAEDDEISRLTTTINHLLDRADESFQLQRLFVANVSHELRNPLTQISSQLEVSLLNPREPAVYRHTIRSVLDDVVGLTALTHDLLQLSRVSEDGATDLLTERVRLDELAWDVRDEVNARFADYQVDVTLTDLPDDPDGLTLPGRRTLLHTALKNLTENACKYADDGRARIAVSIDAQGATLQVENTGQPIPPADLPYLFEPFYRSRQTADGVRGHGVGLSLVRRIVHLHGGRVSVRSQPGEPTRFTISLPRLP